MRNNLAGGFALASISVFAFSLVVSLFSLALPFGVSALDLFMLGLVFMALMLIVRTRRSHR
jgi:hypothetical protein